MRWFGVLVLAAVVAVVVATTVGDAEAARQRWGPTVPVVVAARPLAAGDVVQVDDVKVATYPKGLAPAGALAAPPVGRTVLAALGVGEAVTSVRVSGAGGGGVAALVPAGWRALAVPVGRASVALSVGDEVDLIGTGVDGLSSEVVAEDALVVAVSDEAVTVALPAPAAASAAGAVSAGGVLVALRGAG